MKERKFAELQAQTNAVNDLIKKGGFTQEEWKKALDKLKVANATYNKELRLEKYAELSKTDTPLVMFLMDYSCKSQTSKPVEDKDTKKITYKIEEGVQELFLDEFDDYVHKTANSAWTAQLKVFAREMGVYKLKRFNRATTEKDVAKMVRDAYELESEVRADSKAKLMELLQTVSDMVIPGLEMKDSELAMMENICTARFNGKTGKEDIKVLSLEKQCDLLKYALAHALMDSAYTFDFKGVKKAFRKAEDDKDKE